MSRSLSEMAEDLRSSCEQAQRAITDPEGHQLPADELLQVPLPPPTEVLSIVLGSRQRQLHSQTWACLNTGSSTQDAEALLEARRASLFARQLLESAQMLPEFANVEEDLIAFQQQLARAAASMSREALQACITQASEGLPHGMLLAEGQPPKYHELTQEELDALDTRTRPVSARGLVAFGQVTTDNTLGVRIVVGIDECGDGAAVYDGSNKEVSQQTIVKVTFDAFLAGAEYGCTACVAPLHETAKQHAHETGRLEEYAAALDRYVVELQKLDQSSVAQDVGYFSVICGEAYEELAYKAGPKCQHWQREAVRAYKVGVEFCRERMAGAPAKAHWWSCLGLALKRMKIFDMAERAYRFSIALHVDESVVGNLCQLAIAREGHQSADHDREFLKKQQEGSTQKSLYTEKPSRDYGTPDSWLRGACRSDKLSGTWLPGTILELHSLSRADLNGQLAECASWVAEKERYGVRLLGSPVSWASSDARDVKALRPSNLRLPAAVEDQAQRDSIIRFDSRGHPSNQRRTAREIAEYDAKIGDYLGQYPWSSPMHAALGDSFVARGDHRAMRTHYQRAVANADIESDPQYACGLAYAQANLEMRDEAVRTLEKVLSHVPTYARALLNLGDLLTDDDPRSVTLLSSAIDHAPRTEEGIAIRRNALTGLHKCCSKDTKAVVKGSGRPQQFYDMVSAAAHAFTQHETSGQTASYCYWVLGKCKARQADKLGEGRNLFESNANMARKLSEQYDEPSDEAGMIEQMLALYVGTYEETPDTATFNVVPRSAADYFDRAQRAWHDDNASDGALRDVCGKAAALRGQVLYVRGSSQLLIAARMREVARRHLVSAKSVLEQQPAASWQSVMAARATVSRCHTVLRELSPIDQDGTLVAEALRLLAASARLLATPATAQDVAAELQEALSSTTGWDPESAIGVEVHRTLEHVKALVPREKRRCKTCGALKDKECYSQNQWRKAARRCTACQEAGIITSAEAQSSMDELETEAVEYRRIHRELAQAEDARHQEELRRRNAVERKESECNICFEEIDKAARCVLHDERHWLCRSCLGSLLERQHQEPSCPMCRAPLDVPRLASLLQE